MKKRMMVVVVLILCLSMMACGEPGATNAVPTGGNAPLQTTAPAQTTASAQTTAPTQPDAPTQPTHTHTWEEVTCQTPKTCSTCGATEGGVLGHKWTEATCRVRATCTVCGKTQPGYASHSLEETERVEPTAHQDGSVTYVCSVCGHSSTEVLPATGSVGLEYILRDGTYTVAGIGTCTDSVLVIPAYIDGIKVTGIKAWAFNRCQSITEVVIPSTVIEIDECAFMECTNLLYVEIQEGVTAIGHSAFAWCENLRIVELPASVTSIGDHAFAICGYLNSINYWGSEEAWMAIDKGEGWDTYAGISNSQGRYTLIFDFDGAKG